MVPLIAGILAALEYAPAVFTAGKSIVEAVTGDVVPEVANTPAALTEHIASLPSDQQAEIHTRLIEMQSELQRLDTARFVAMTDGDADKLRASARPQIALKAMAVISLFGSILKWLALLAVVQWLFEVGVQLFDSKIVVPTIWDQLAKLAPVTELIWGPAIASLAACVQVITKYMGCRERDKAQEYEIKAGKPLDSAQATIQAAGGMVSSVIRAIKS